MLHNAGRLSRHPCNALLEDLRVMGGDKGQGDGASQPLMVVLDPCSTRAESILTVRRGVVEDLCDMQLVDSWPAKARGLSGMKG